MRRRLNPRASTCIAAIGLLAVLLAVASGKPPAPANPGAASPSEDLAVPDDIALREQLDRAVDLRTREDFDRFLDAREEGELIEHATLTDADFEHRELAIDTLFIFGDELFGLLFRPQNGWGTGVVDREVVGYTPRRTRVHRGATGGPDAFGCFSCHSKGGPDGAGTQTQVAFLRGDGERTVSADERNAPHLLGLGPIAALAIEMSATLRRQAAEAGERAKAQGGRVEQPLNAKGVAFGHVVADADGKLDYSAVEGVDPDLTIRPFGWKGHQATLRDMIEESFHIHQGLLSNRIQEGVRDGTVEAGPYGKGKFWFDLDEDGVSVEIDSGMLTTMVGYLAQLEAPVMRPPRDPGLLDAFAAGSARFESIGCASCHVPILELDDPKLETRPPNAGDRASFIVDVARDGDGPKIEPKYASPTTPYRVNLFSDLKRHDMGAALATPAAQASIPASVFLTRPLWGLAETAPYLHDGRAPTLQDAIALHGGEAAAARDAYMALDESGQASVRVFLTSLSREPKVFLP